MKRCVKWLTNWFKQWVGKMEWEEKIGFSCGAITGLIIGIMVFGVLDTVPATPMDYKPLEDKMAMVQQDPQSLFTTNCEINVKDEIIIVRFENDECAINVQYDKNFEVLSCSKADKSAFWLGALGLSVVVGGGVYGACAYLLILLIYLFEIAWKFIGKNMRLRFRKAQK